MYGMNRHLEKLTTVFDVNATNKAYVAFETWVALETCIRPDNVSVADFILDFERRYSKVNAQKMTIPNSVLACKLLHCCNLGDNEGKNGFVSND